MKHRVNPVFLSLLIASVSGLASAQSAQDANTKQKPTTPLSSGDTKLAPAEKSPINKEPSPVANTSGEPTDANAKPVSQPTSTQPQLPTNTESPASNAAEIAALKEEIKALHTKLDEVSENAATNTDIQGLQTDVENFKYQYQRERETKSATSTRNLLIGGIVQTRFAWTSEAMTTPVPGTYQNTSVNNPPYLHYRRTTFDIPNAILSFNGLLYRDYEAARNLQFQLSAAASPATSNAGLGANNINSFFTVLDANITYQVLPTIENDGNRFSIKAGQFLVPFGLEANTTEELRPVINNAQFVPATGFNLRQIGVAAHGEFFAQYDFGYNYRQALIAFDVGALNGNGPNRDDDNAHKDVFGRIAVTLPAEYNSWLRELRVGASGYLGKQSLFNAYTAAQTVPPDGGYNSEGKKNRFGVDVYYNHFPFGVTYEHVWLDTEVLVANARTDVKANADTVTVFYSFGEQFLNSIKNQGKFDDWWPKTYQPFFRYDRYVPSTTLATNRTGLATLGLNIFFAETTKFQLNATRRVQETTPHNYTKSGEVLAQLQFGF